MSALGGRQLVVLFCPKQVLYRLDPVQLAQPADVPGMQPFVPDRVGDHIAHVRADQRQARDVRLLQCLIGDGGQVGHRFLVYRFEGGPHFCVRRTFLFGQALRPYGEMFRPTEFLERPAGGSQEQSVLAHGQMCHQPERRIQLHTFTYELAVGVHVFQAAQVHQVVLTRAVHHVREYLGFGLHRWSVWPQRKGMLFTVDR